MIPSWARKGVRVVCVDDKPRPGWDACSIRKGGVYTIVGVIDSDRSGDWGVLLKEAISVYGYEGGFKGYRFKPHVPEKTMAEDVALIKAHLRTPEYSSTSGEGRVDERV